MQRMPLAAARAARGLAVDGNDVGPGLAQPLDPGREAFRKQCPVERVHHVVERIMRGDAARKGQKPA